MEYAQLEAALLRRGWRVISRTLRSQFVKSTHRSRPADSDISLAPEPNGALWIAIQLPRAQATRGWPRLHLRAAYLPPLYIGSGLARSSSIMGLLPRSVLYTQALYFTAPICSWDDASVTWIMTRMLPCSMSESVAAGRDSAELSDSGRSSGTLGHCYIAPFLAIYHLG